MFRSLLFTSIFHLLLLIVLEPRAALAGNVPAFAHSLFAHHFSRCIYRPSREMCTAFQANGNFIRTAEIEVA